MAKRKITKTELEAAISEHAGNVSAIARALNVKPQTIYNTCDAYDMRDALETARSSAIKAASIALRKSPIGIRRALIALAESTGGITKAELVALLPEPISTARPFQKLQKLNTSIDE